MSHSHSPVQHGRWTIVHWHVWFLRGTICPDEEDAPRDQSAMQAYNEPIAADLPKEQRGKMLEERKGTAVR